jgi:hypothetical protein
MNERGESNMIPTPRVHSSIDTSRRSKRIVLEPKDIIIEPQLNNKNVNHYISPIPEMSLHQSEQIIKTKYTDLLINFFQTRQPSYIFEPLRKEYYWTDEPFDEEKTTRLENFLHNTSYFVQSIFWYLRILLAVCITIPIEIIHTILAGLFKPILIRIPIIISDTLIKPFSSGLFNAFMYVFFLSFKSS